jgi:RNA polymerase sigma factor (sigma-70 family)
VAAAISGSREAAPELVQEAFARAVRESERFRGDGPVDGWIWRIVTNVALNFRRDSRPAGELDFDAASGDPVDDECGRVRNAIRRLPEQQRLVLFLRYYADLDYGAIAEAVGIASGTVGATLNAARAALLDALGTREVHS